MTEAEAPGSVGRAGLVLASGTLVSRALGFINMALLSWVIGVSNPSATAFTVANGLPNSIFLLISGGLLSAVLVPQIVRAGSDADGGTAFINRLLTLGGCAFAAVALIATVGAPVLVAIYANQSGQLAGEGHQLATAFAFWCVPQVFLYAMFSLLGEVLNARRVFGPVTWAPVLNNVVSITVLLVFGTVFGTDPKFANPASWTPGMVALLAGGATLGILVQLLGLLAAWRRTGVRFRPDFHWRGVGLGATGRTAFWTFGMILVSQLGGVLASQLTTSVGAHDPSSRAQVLAWAIFVLPHSLVTLSIAMPYFTRMSAHAHAGRIRELVGDFSESLRTVTLLTAGAAVAIGAAAVPFSAIFSSEAEAPGVAWVLLAYLLGLVPFSMLFLVQRAFFALGDTRTPFFVQLVQTGVFALVALALFWMLPSGWRTAGVALATTVSWFVQLGVQAALLRRRTGGIDAVRILASLARYALAALPAAVVGSLAFAALGGFGDGIGGVFGAAGFTTANRFTALAATAIIGAITAAVYFAALLALRIPELRVVLATARRMLHRRAS